MPKKSTLENIDDWFWSKFKREGECLLWTGYTNQKGRGRVAFDGKLEQVHRFVYLLHNGFDSLAELDEVCHTCDTPSCGEYSHLFKGTHWDNMLDMAIKGRGGNRPKRKITDEQKLEVIALSRNGMSQRKIASIYGVTHQSICFVLNGRIK